MIKDYLKGKRSKEPRLVELSRLAIETSHRSDVLVTIRQDKPTSCVLCKRHYDAAPHAIPAKGHIEVILICENCLPQINEDNIADAVYNVADHNRADSVYLWRDASKTVQMLDNGLHWEKLDAEG